ncbi:MAG TPA: dienelactone hydrolase family protein [Xanthobacteraceae bacterium]|nr:dienelactone hydrolase family protein [Xanthobacteraceae bacterium]
MAGATRPLPVILVEQVEYIAMLHGPADEAATKRITEIKLEAARALAAQPGDAGRKILGAAPGYWADLNAYDPAAAAARLSRPLLIVQGDRDYQVTADDLQRFKTALAGHPNVTIREFPRLNHLFMSGDGKSRPEEYRRPGHVDAEVIETLVQFVSSLPK